MLDAEGWFPTRDIATLDAGGYLFIGGRSDDTIIRGGENISPAELEDVLVEHPHVREVAVVGVEDPQWGQAIVAVVVPAVGADPDAEELREHVRKSLRGSRTPDRVVFRDELPATRRAKFFAATLSKSFALRPTVTGPRIEIMIKNGSRLASQVCDTQVIIVPSADSLDDSLRPAPMVELNAESSGALDPAFADGSVDGQALCGRPGAEVLVTKAGAGTLAVGETVLSLKEAKPLPASD